MRAAELIAPLTFRHADMPIEDPGPGEVQLRVEAVGVCGSDLHAYTEGAVGNTPNVYPMVLGHEPAGQIVKTGAGVIGRMTRYTTVTRIVQLILRSSTHLFLLELQDERHECSEPRRFNYSG